MSAGVQWYVMFGSERRGPFTLEAMIGSGLRPDSLVWRAGMPGWVRAADVPELVHAMRAPAPPQWRPPAQTAAWPPPQPQAPMMAGAAPGAAAPGQIVIAPQSARAPVGSAVWGLLVVAVLGAGVWAFVKLGTPSGGMTAGRGEAPSRPRKSRPTGTADTADRFVSDEGRFAVRFPSEPKFSKTTKKTDVGVIDVNNYMAEIGGSAYAASYTDYPESIIDLSDPEAILDGAAKGQADAVGGTLVESTRVEIDGHPGRATEVDVSEAKGVVWRSNTYLVGERLYQVVVVQPAAADDRDRARRFFDSFMLLPR